VVTLRPATISVDRALIMPKAFYFFFFSAIASLFPYLAVYYQSINLSGSQIGLLTGIPPFVMVISAPVWGAVADATRQHRRLLVLAVTLSLISIYLISIAMSFPILIILTLVNSFAFSAVMPMTDNAVMQMLGDRKGLYGKQRLWGSIGFGIIAPLIGILTDEYGLVLCFYGFLLFMFFCLLVVWRFPSYQASIAPKIWNGMGSLIKSRKWLSFLWLVFVAGIGMTVIQSFLFLRLNDLGASNFLMGLSLTIATISELPVFFYSEQMLKRWKARSIIIFSMWMYVIRNLALAFIRAPTQVLPVQLLNGITFSSLWTAAVTYTSEISPPGMGATGQGLLSATQMGLGGAVGGVMGGYLYQSQGSARMFAWIGVIQAFGTILFILAERLKRPGEV